MMASTYAAGFVATLRGEAVSWADLGMTRNELLALCDREELHPLLLSRIGASEQFAGWPPDVRDALTQSARDATAREMLRRDEIATVLSELAAAGTAPIVVKGTALAYTAYDAPALRPRLDTDIMIDAVERGVTRRVLEGCGYVAPPYCDELFAQFQMERTDRFGLRHVIDVHWKISTQPMFADALDHERMLSRAIPVPALGMSAVAPCAVDALLLACMHPVMHHQNTERILWTCDTHLLASALQSAEWGDFVDCAVQERVAAVCAHGLQGAHALFDTPVPPDVMSRLTAISAEPSAAYLASHRKWHHELASSLRGSQGFANRVKLLRKVLLPSREYMLAIYGLDGKPLGPWLLPVLYVHRNARGAWKILAGKK